MAGLSESIQARLKALSDVFLKELPVRMEQIAEAAKQTLKSSGETPELRELRHHAHKLAGSAATFGFHHVTACSKRLEHMLDQLLDNDVSPDSEGRQSIRMLVSELLEAGRIRSAEGGVDEPGGNVEELEEVVSLDAPDEPIQALTPDDDEPPIDPDAARKVAVLVPDANLAVHLADRFAFYGFDPIVLEGPEELRSLGSRARSIALVTDTRYIHDDPTVAQAVNALSEKVHGRLQIVYLSDRDDFEMRLLGVRSAGAAFFSSPFDINRILDTVDGLTSDAGGEPYHVLIVDDDAEQVSYHALILQRAGMITSVVSDPRNMFAVLIETKPDLILMDMYMPGCSGPELASIIRQQEAFVGVPIVFLSIETDEDKQFQALSRGGDGFLAKPIKAEHLVTAVSHRVDRTRSMRFFMERDSLTGLLNHTNLMESLSTEVQRSERVNCGLCFAMIDIDHFKRVNDTFGHLTGDRVLKSLSRLLTDRLRKTDVIGRYGGEEFGVVMFNVDAANASRIMNSIREDFESLPHETAGDEFHCTFSCGIASFPAFDGPGPISEAADRALYEAKESGRNRVIVAAPKE